MLTAIKDFLIELIRRTGYLGVFIAMTLESCLIPLPSEITMGLAGALVFEGDMNIHVASFVGAIANVVGSLMAYWIGYKLPEAKILKFIKKWGKFILLTEHEYIKSKNWIKKYGNWISFGSRLLPGIRTVISLPAGVAQIKLVPFTLYTFAGSLIWSYFLTFLGFKFGEHWEQMEVYFKKFELVIIGAMVLFVAWYVWHKVKKRSENKKG